MKSFLRYSIATLLSVWLLLRGWAIILIENEKPILFIIALILLLIILLSLKKDIMEEK